MAKNIDWLGHDSFRLKGEKTVYIDPWKLDASAEPADVILITHPHGDHLSPTDIQRISKPGTIIVAPQVVADKIRADKIGAEKLGADKLWADKLGGKPMLVKPGDAINAAGVAIEVVPAYNTNKPNHPKEAGHVGYIVTLKGQRIYHAGDTDLIPEMTKIKCDVALLPVSGKYVMNALEAAEAAKTLGPAVAIPMHWGDPDVVGTRADAEEFKRLAQVPVEILEKVK